jgi:hypothetical protein
MNKARDKERRKGGGKSKIKKIKIIKGEAMKGRL